MRHSREKGIERTIREFELLDQVVAGLSDEAMTSPLRRTPTAHRSKRPLVALSGMEADNASQDDMIDKVEDSTIGGQHMCWHSKSEEGRSSGSSCSEPETRACLMAPL